jgi:carbonic anhydrase
MAERPDNLSATEALDQLKTGNQRFVEGASQHPHCTPERRTELTAGQRPFATVITCADSRVPVELLFDQGLGDVFVIRVAGNIADDAVLGSIEYASLHLGVNLIVVMGHQSCGAVGAAVDGSSTGTHIDSLIDAIRPAVERATNEGEEDLLERSVRHNATMVADQIRSSDPVLSGLEPSGVVVTPAYYDLGSGEVDWLS